jgi:chromate reductase, NAD(P)H dehydrogenase (quinone)
VVRRFGVLLLLFSTVACGPGEERRTAEGINAERLVLQAEDLPGYRAALRAATQLVPEDATLDVFELDGIPAFNQDEEQNPPPKVVDLKRRIREADAILIVTPEYNYSIPGVLKNAIDWASRPYGDSAWNEKPVALMGASIGTIGTARAQYHLRQVFVFLNMFPINQPEVMISNAGERFDAEGNLRDETTKKLIRQLLQSLVDWTRRLRHV